MTKTISQLHPTQLGALALRERNGARASKGRLGAPVAVC